MLFKAYGSKRIQNFYETITGRDLRMTSDRFNLKTKRRKLLIAALHSFSASSGDNNRKKPNSSKCDYVILCWSNRGGTNPRDVD